MGDFLKGFKLKFCFITFVVLFSGLAEAGQLFYKSGFGNVSTCGQELSDSRAASVVGEYYAGEGTVEYATLEEVLTQDGTTERSATWAHISETFKQALMSTDQRSNLVQALSYLVLKADLSKIRIFLPEPKLNAKPGSGLEPALGATVFDLAQPGFVLNKIDPDKGELPQDVFEEFLQIARDKSSGATSNSFDILFNPKHMTHDLSDFNRTLFHELIHVADLMRIADRIASGYRPPDLLRPTLEAGVWVIPYQWFHFMIETRAYLLNLRQLGFEPLSEDERADRFLNTLGRDLFRNSLHLPDNESPLVEFRAINVPMLFEMRRGLRPFDQSLLINRDRLRELDIIYQGWFEKAEAESNR